MTDYENQVQPIRSLDCELTHNSYELFSRIGMSIMNGDIVKDCQFVAASLGYAKLKEEQRSVIINFVSGNDVFAVMPTGYGKTVCYVIICI